MSGSRREPPTAGGRVRARNVVAVLSEDRFDAPVAWGQEVRGLSLMGSVRLDLGERRVRSGGSGQRIDVRARGGFGSVEILTQSELAERRSR